MDARLETERLALPKRGDLMISVGSQFQTHRGVRYEILDLLGEGGQGSVYEVANVSGGERLALKYYHESSATADQRVRLEALIERGPPDVGFLWPIEVVEIAGTGSFGYLMPLRGSSSVGLSDLVTGRVDPSLRVICTLGLELSHRFLLLHADGLCYRDISFGNVFFEPTTGHVLICDNDNVGIDGTGAAAVLGTKRFMAPEVLRGTDSPSADTDLYSLAVLLFYILMVGHPLLGRRELEYSSMEAAEDDLFGRRPVFIFDPNDRSNAPDQELHDSVILNWPLYPPFIHDLFTTSFTSGLTDPRNGRVRESVWRSRLVRLRDAITRCLACGVENFYDETAPTICWSCQRPIEPPLRLLFDGGSSTVLMTDTHLSGHHLNGDYDFASLVAAVVHHPRQPDLWGLRNDSSFTWQVQPPLGDASDVEPGQTLSLIPGSIIRFGRTSAQIVI